MEIRVRTVRPDDGEEWLRLRRALWPEEPQAETHPAEIEAYFAEAPKEWAVLVAERPGGGLCGLLEASVRRLAEGWSTKPVGYIEGWYVDEDVRRQGIGARLVREAERWARALGCREMESDCVLENDASRRSHLALGYAETERLIHFRKSLTGGNQGGV